MRRARSEGMTLAETLLAVALLGIAILMASAVLTWADRVDERARMRNLALDLASSVAERARATGYDDVRDGDLDPSELNATGLPEAAVHVAVKEDEGLHLKDVAITVAWGGKLKGAVTVETAVSAAGPYR